MLVATKECLESIKDGVVQSIQCVDARGHLLVAAQSADAAARRAGASLSVDDELASMDRAIQEAATQIEVGPILLRFFNQSRGLKWSLIDYFSIKIIPVLISAV
jgi:hypothetical protein